MAAKLAQARSGPDDRRTGLASFVQFTDLHIIGTQSPARFEYMHPFVASTGHTHLNKVLAHHGDTPAQGFWEINTASHIDFPQHARVIEVADTFPRARTAPPRSSRRIPHRAR